MITLDFALLMALVLALVQLVKQIFLTSKLVPLLALMIGVASSILFFGLTSASIVMGLISALSAMGLYSGTKTTLSD